jgi:predicted TIM-barrel fold metal-dependent hydrolase
MPLQIIDTHQHLWDLSRHRHPWCADIPMLNRSFLPADYAQAAEQAPPEARISKAVFVECDAHEADLEAEALWILEIASRPGSLTAGVVAGCRPEQDGFEAHLDRIAHPRLRGVRRVLHTQPDDLSCSALFADNLRTLPARGLTFDLCVLARQLPIAAELVRRCPDTRFILDHCGVPDVKGRVLDPWRNDLRALAREPNVIGCKISGLVAYADPATWTIEDLRPFVEHTVECFGPTRIMFGGDWPVCTLTCPLGRWVEAALQLTADWPAADRTALFSTNAEHIYRI